MHKRAVKCFEAQTYQNAELIVYEGPRTTTIGKLRNEANGKAHGSILAHLDEDDWSHPNRLAEQVALLQSGDWDAVGYSDMLFWDTRNAPAAPGVCRDIDGNWWHPQGSCEHCDGGEAWLYHHPLPNYALGTSLMYWRRTWEAKPFADLPQAGNDVCEDFVFQSGLRVKSVSSFGHPNSRWEDGSGELPRMIASIHSSNSRKASYDDALRRAEMFTRVPDWDGWCAERMKL